MDITNLFCIAAAAPHSEKIYNLSENHHLIVSFEDDFVELTPTNILAANWIYCCPPAPKPTRDRTIRMEEIAARTTRKKGV